MFSNSAVVVGYSRTSCIRRPGLDACGTRTHATSEALPKSSAAIRATCSSTSSTSSILSSLLANQPPAGGRPREPSGIGSSRTLVLIATLRGPEKRAPSTKLTDGLTRAKETTASASGQTPFSQPHGVPAGDPATDLLFRGADDGNRTSVFSLGSRFGVFIGVSRGSPKQPELQ